MYGTLELTNAKIGTKKAPGNDGILNYSIKLTFRVEPTKLLNASNGLLENTKFLEKYRRARLALISKPRKEKIIEISPYGSICLTDALSKIYESKMRRKKRLIM